MGHDNHPGGKAYKNHSHNHNAGHEYHDHSHMIADYKNRFWISLGLTIPILLLSPIAHKSLGFDDTFKLFIILF